MDFGAKEFFDLDHTAHSKLFEAHAPAWDALKQIGTYLKFRLKPANHGTMVGRPFISNMVFIGEGTVIEHGAMVRGPAWIGAGCHIRNGAYIRENVIVGDNVTLGNSCEFKNCLIFDEAEIPHFNYVGDSILGYKAHLGAGVILSNVRLDRNDVQVTSGVDLIPTGLRKFGAIVGDHAEVGCNAVINPGSILGRKSLVYPGSVWAGVLAANHIAKTRQTQMVVERK